MWSQSGADDHRGMSVGLQLVACAAGLGLLAWAADEFVVGAARVAALLRVSPVVIGAVVVGFGTSAPELLVSGLAASQGDAALGVGNVLGSNIANLTLVLGVASLVAVMHTSSGVLRREIPMALGASVLFALLVQDGLGLVDGLVLALVLVVVLVALVRDARVTADRELVGEVREYVGDERGSSRVELLRTAAGLAGTLLGAQLLVWGAVELAAEVGLGEGFVGLTLVAVGTSLPELVTAVQAARKREDELIVGNLLGSTIFNSLAVGAVLGFVGAGSLDDRAFVRTASVVMVSAVVLGAAFLVTRRRVERWEGVALLAAYAAAMPVIAR